jgi:hypothetical protein
MKFLNYKRLHYVFFSGLIFLPFSYVRILSHLISGNILTSCSIKMYVSIIPQVQVLQRSSNKNYSMYLFTQNSGFLDVFIVWYSREHDVSETGYVSVLRRRWGRRHLLSLAPQKELISVTELLRLALSKGPN